jgi:hypothetical protein
LKKKIESPVKDQLNTVISDGVIPSVLLVNTADNRVLAELNTSGVNSAPYTWKSWENPNYVERLKKSYDIIRKFFEKLK